MLNCFWRLFITVRFTFVSFSSYIYRSGLPTEVRAGSLREGGHAKREAVADSGGQQVLVYSCKIRQEKTAAKGGHLV